MRYSLKKRLRVNTGVSGCCMSALSSLSALWPLFLILCGVLSHGRPLLDSSPESVSKILRLLRWVVATPLMFLTYQKTGAPDQKGTGYIRVGLRMSFSAMCS